jgi:hypothetical protein
MHKKYYKTNIIKRKKEFKYNSCKRKELFGTKFKIYVQDKNEDFVDNSFNKFAFNLSNCLL